MGVTRTIKLVDIDCQIMSEREKTIAIADGSTFIDVGGVEKLKWFWLPRSQIEIEPNGTRWIVSMPEWLAKDRGLI